MALVAGNCCTLMDKNFEAVDQSMLFGLSGVVDLVRDLGASGILMRKAAHYTGILKGLVIFTIYISYFIQLFI